MAGVVLALVALGCAAPGTRDGDSAPLPSASAPEPTVRPEVEAQGGPAGDGPPNHADNNGWKQRNDLSADEQRTGEKLAARIRPKLAALRKAGDFAPASTRQALLDLGIAADSVEVTAMRAGIGAETPPPGAVYAVRFPERGCVVGDVRPERVLVEVRGSAAEYGCLEPFSH